jgi:hypothetical protein
MDLLDTFLRDDTDEQLLFLVAERAIRKALPASLNERGKLRRGLEVGIFLVDESCFTPANVTVQMRILDVLANKTVEVFSIGVIDIFAGLDRTLKERIIFFDDALALVLRTRIQNDNLLQEISKSGQFKSFMEEARNTPHQRRGGLLTYLVVIVTDGHLVIVTAGHLDILMVRHLNILRSVRKLGKSVSDFRHARENIDKGSNSLPIRIRKPGSKCIHCLLAFLGGSLLAFLGLASLARRFGIDHRGVGSRRDIFISKAGVSNGALQSTSWGRRLLWLENELQSLPFP